MFKAADDKRGCPGGAVLSYGFWQKEFGGATDVLGKTISLNSHRFPVIGVIQPGFGGVDPTDTFRIGSVLHDYLKFVYEPAFAVSGILNPSLSQTMTPLRTVNRQRKRRVASKRVRAESRKPNFPV
jgi:hypothetical protein